MLLKSLDLMQQTHLVTKTVIDVHVRVLMIATIEMHGVGVQQLVCKEDGDHLNAVRAAIHQIPVEQILRTCRPSPRVSMMAPEKAVAFPLPRCSTMCVPSTSQQQGGTF